MRTRSLTARILLVVLFALVLVRLPVLIADRTSSYAWFDPVVDIRSMLERDYVESLDDEAMRSSTIEGMLETLDDPYTEFIPPEDLADFDKLMHGNYVGIGAEVAPRDGYVGIITPMEDSPALEAGVRAGDLVLAIEGESTLNMPLDEAIDRIMGAPGTTVEITVRHLDGVEENLAVERRRIHTRTVRGLRRLDGEWSYCLDADHDLAYVRITQFTETTAAELHEALDEISADGGPGGLVLDLRDNGGGALPAAIDVADAFLTDGVIVSVKDRRGRGSSWSATRGDRLDGAPIIVLINGFSASASEIVAGALQDHERAVLLGVRTFGKGSVQEIRRLPGDNGVIKLTTQYYYLPSGRSIHKRSGATRWGVDPTPGMVVELSRRAYFNLILARREFETIRDDADDAPSCADLSFITESLGDGQLGAAVEALHERIDDGRWPRLNEIEVTTAAYADEMEQLGRRRGELLDALMETDERLELLSAASEEAGARPLLPDDIDVTSAVMELRTEAGDVIGRYRFRNADLRAVLWAAGAERIDDGTEGAVEQP